MLHTTRVISTLRKGNTVQHTELPWCHSQTFGGSLTTIASSSSLVVLLLAALVASASAQDWVTARATFYGLDAWSLHNGACGFGYICQNRWGSQLAEGWDVAAISVRSNLNTGAQCGCALSHMYICDNIWRRVAAGVDWLMLRCCTNPLAHSRHPSRERMHP